MSEISPIAWRECFKSQKSGRDGQKDEIWGRFPAVVLHQDMELEEVVME